MFRKGVSHNEFAQHMQKKFKKLEEKKGNPLKELAITDAYALKYDQRYEHPLSVLNSCLNHIEHLKKIRFVVNRSVKDDEQIRAGFNQYFLDNSVQKIEVIFDKDFHDRFWFINKKKAFIVGTSLNTIGNKHFFVQDKYFKSKDVEVLLDLCFPNGELREQLNFEKDEGEWKLINIFNRQS